LEIAAPRPLEMGDGSQRRMTDIHASFVLQLVPNGAEE